MYYVTRDEMVHTCCEAVQQKTKELEAAKNAIGFHMILKMQLLAAQQVCTNFKVVAIVFLNFLWKSIGVLGLFFHLI